MCRLRQTLAPLHQHGGLNGAFAYVRFLSYGNEIHTCATVKEPIEDKIFKILNIISHIIYDNRGTALSTSQIYAYLLKVIKVLLLLEGRLANMTCINTFMHPFYALHLSLSLMTKTLGTKC